MGDDADVASQVLAYCLDEFTCSGDLVGVCRVLSVYTDDDGPCGWVGFAAVGCVAVFDSSSFPCLAVYSDMGVVHERIR